ncbi:MAG TPA: hypothetical protein VGF38_10435 [Ktedonobacterales bacterium]|jgi:hypothetical protein
MSREGQAYAQEIQRETATRLATDLVRAHHDDLEARVRLVFSTGMDGETTYHFDGYWPTWGKQSRVVVQSVGVDRWTATFVDDPTATS